MTCFVSGSGHCVLNPGCRTRAFSQHLTSELRQPGSTPEAKQGFLNERFGIIALVSQLICSFL